VIDFAKWRNAEDWIDRQSLEIALVIVARTTLRMIPQIALEVPFADGYEWHASILSIFRAAAIVTFGAEIEKFDKQYRAAAEDASVAATDAADELASAASDVASIAAAAVAVPSISAKGFYTAISDLTGVDYEAINADVRFVEEGVSQEDKQAFAENLLRAPLWLVGTPPNVHERWSSLRWALPRDEQWWVWFEWFEARLAGSENIPPLETIIDSIPEGVWTDGASTINSTIARRIVESGSRDTLSQQQGSTPIPGPTAIRGVLSPVDFLASPGRPIRAVPSLDTKPRLETPVDRQDHKPRLDLCRANARSLLDLVQERTVNVREAYGRALSAYLAQLPTTTRKRNMLLADQEARILRDLFAADVAILPTEFAVRLRAMLQSHQALRVFYPGIARFYDDVRFGRNNDPLPIDSAERILAIVAATPELFDASVQQALVDAAPPLPPALKLEGVQLPGSPDPQPPLDPIGDVPTEKAQAYARAGTINRLWAFFQKGEMVGKNSEAWIKTGATLAPHVTKIVDWLSKFISAGSSAG
jgi:hypothetical protein